MSTTHLSAANAANQTVTMEARLRDPQVTVPYDSKLPTRCAHTPYLQAASSLGKCLDGNFIPGERREKKYDR